MCIYIYVHAYIHAYPPPLELLLPRTILVWGLGVRGQASYLNGKQIHDHDQELAKQSRRFVSHNAFID